MKPRVLAIAEAANPEWVSVPLVGWSLAHALRDVADVHLVTQIRNRDSILRAGLREGLSEGPSEGGDVTFIDTEPLLRPLWRLSRIARMGSGRGWTTSTAISALAYPYFERLVWRRFGPDIEAGRYDLVHRITPLTPTTVSPIAAKCARAGVPFVLGPLNGGVPWPKGFDSERRREREWLSYVRGAYRLMPGRRQMYKSSGAILVGSRHTESEIPDEFRDKTVWLPENAIDPSRFNRVAEPYAGGPLRACFIGRLVPYKGPDMLLEAAEPLLRSGRMVLDIIGDGPMRRDLEARIETAGLGGAVTFHGLLSHQEVQNVAARTHILSFPSIREFGGGVVLEAMSLGVVPVVVDYAGPGELVDETVGYKVAIGTRAEIVAALRDCLSGIAEKPEQLQAKAIAARARVAAHFTWSAKARQVRRVYDWVLGDVPEKPQLVALSQEQEM